VTSEEMPVSLLAERILVLGMTPLAQQLICEIDNRPASRHVVVGVLDEKQPSSEHYTGRVFLGHTRNLRKAVDQLRPDRIVVAFAERRGRTPVSALLDSFVSRGAIIEDAADFYERLTGKFPLESLAPMSVILSGRFRPSAIQQAFARILSLSIAVLALVTLSPLLAVIAVAIKLDSPGPVFFRQRRVGVHGRPFTLLKFRTMHDASPRRSEWEGDNRDRVTKVGRWLRNFRVDEIPQFVNILRGEMNLVGPRPHPVSNLELLTLVARNLNELTGAAIGCYSLRLIVRPGLTGWAQVRYRYANNLDEEIEKLRYDLYYVKHLSPWLDVRILLETIKVLVRGRSAEHEAEAAVERPGPFPFPRKIGRTNEA
jgi:exopolysaccharide biosynthesis polyprenyl glycosylphosphotransferase